MIKFDFKNKEGDTLSGRLERPSGEPLTYALFAHCFTCSKDIIAASVISKKLTEQGIAVLRFDFTGLGNSDGDFSNTNFSSNVDDLLQACAELRKQFKAPELLIGHSLGGAAVLHAATQMEEVKAVVTIAAPSSADHLTHLFTESIDEIKKKGAAEVDLAGRRFVIKKQFIDDLNEIDVLEGIKNFRKSLLVLHSPTDNVVSIDHAAKIFAAAKHPKSFISLDTADHVLASRDDAEYVAEAIGAWVSRYLTPKKKRQSFPTVAQGEVLVRTRPGARFTADVLSANHHVVADEPLSMEGDDLGMNPYEFLLASLGTCTSMTLFMYAKHKKLALEQVEVELSHKKIHAKDCDDCSTKEGKLDRIEKRIRVSGNLSIAEKKRLYEIAERCPVNRTLLSEISIKSFHEDLT